MPPPLTITVPPETSRNSAVPPECTFTTPPLSTVAPLKNWAAATSLVTPLLMVTGPPLPPLLAPLDTVETKLGYLRSRGHEVVVMRVLDPAEVEFPFQEAALFQDVESGRELYIDPQVARERYRQRFSEHAAGLAKACNKLGIDLLDLVTDRPLELALFDFLSTRLRRGRHVARRTTVPRNAAGGGR